MVHKLSYRREKLLVKSTSIIGNVNSDPVNANDDALQTPTKKRGEEGEAERKVKKTLLAITWWAARLELMRFDFTTK